MIHKKGLLDTSYVKRPLVDVVQLTIGDFQTDQFSSKDKRLAGQPNQRVSVELELAQFRYVLERLGGNRGHGVVAEIQLDEIGQSGESRRVNVPKRTALQDNTLQMGQAQFTELIDAQLR